MSCRVLCELGIPIGEWNHPYVDCTSRLFYFSFSFWVFLWDARGCWFSLSCGVSLTGVLYVTLLISSEKWENNDWLHLKYQMMCMESYAVRWPQGNRSNVECFQSACVKERPWVLIQMKDPLRIILHFIAFCIAFYCQLDLQWENYTMLVFCFIMLLFLIFQNIRNLLLYVMAEKYFLPWSIQMSLRKNDVKLENSHFPLFWCICGSESISTS